MIVGINKRLPMLLSPTFLSIYFQRILYLISHCYYFEELIISFFIIIFFLFLHLFFFQGKGLFATKFFKAGDIIFEEFPVVSCQFAWNETFKYLACELCMR